MSNDRYEKLALRARGVASTYEYLFDPLLTSGEVLYNCIHRSVESIYRQLYEQQGEQVLVVTPPQIVVLPQVHPHAMSFFTQLHIAGYLRLWNHVGRHLPKAYIDEEVSW